MTPSEKLMKDVVEAWGKADFGPLRAALHDDVVWISAATNWNDTLRSGGVHRGRAAVIALHAKLATAFFGTACTAKEIVSGGEILWGLFSYTGNYQPGREATPRSFGIDLALRWRVRHAKILEAQTFFDTLELFGQIHRSAVA